MSSVELGGAPYLFSQSGTFPAPYTFKVPATLELQTDAASATYNGAGAGGDFLPALSFYSPEGVRLATIPIQTAALSPGDSAEVSWFPFAPAASSGAVTTETRQFMVAQLTSFTNASGSGGTARVVGWTVAASHGVDTSHLNTAGQGYAVIQTAGNYLVTMRGLVKPNVAGNCFLDLAALDSRGTELVPAQVAYTAIQQDVQIALLVPRCDVGTQIGALLRSDGGSVTFGGNIPGFGAAGGPFASAPTFTLARLEPTILT